VGVNIILFPFLLFYFLFLLLKTQSVKKVETQNPKLSCIELIVPSYVAGMEAVGVVTAVGAGLTGRQVGDLVAYAGC